MSQARKRKPKLPDPPPARNQVSVSEAKAHLSSVLRQAQTGQSIVVTDHGKAIARIEGIQEPNRLRTLAPQRRFSEVKDIRAPVPESSSARSVLDLLREDREAH